MLYFSRWKSILIWLVVAMGVLFAFPNILTQRQLEAMPNWLPDRPMTLGLDLQGGSYILLEVDRASLVAARLNSVRDDAQLQLRNGNVGFTDMREVNGGVEFRLRDPAQAAAARTALRPLTDPVSSGLMAGGTITEVDLTEPQSGAFRLTLTEQGINHRLSTAVSQSIEVVRRRVDELGTTEPVIQRQGVDRIMVQVPGLQDPARLKALLNQTAQLTFRLVDLQHSAEAVAAGQQPAPAGSQLLYTTDNPAMPILVQRQVMVSGENLTDAQAGFDQQTNAAVVNIRFDSRGAQRFGAVTQQTPSLVSPQGVSGLDFGDPSTAVNRVADQLTDGNAGESVDGKPWEAMLKAHALWCATGGAEGEPSVFDGADLRNLLSIRGMNLTALSAKGAVVSAASCTVERPAA